MTAGHDLLSLAGQLKAQGRLDQAAEALERAALHFARTGLMEETFTAWWDAAQAWLANGDTARADSALVGALPYARSMDELIAVDSALINLLAISGRAALAIPIAARLAGRLSAADAAIDVRRAIPALQNLSLVAYQMKDSFDAILAAGNTLRGRVEGDPALCGRVDYMQALLLNMMGCPLAADALLKRAEHLLHDRGELLQLPGIANQMARAAEVRGAAAEAAAQLARTEVLLSEAGAGDYYKFVVRGGRSLVLAGAGDLEEAIAAFHGALAVAKADEPLSDLMRVRAAAVAAACGLRDEALQWLRTQPHLARERLIAVRALWLMARLSTDADERGALLARAAVDCPSGDLHDQACQEALDLRQAAVAADPEAITFAIERAEAKGMLGLVRHLSVTAAGRAAAQGALDLAASHAQRAVRLEDFMDCWIDEHASCWSDVRPILVQCGLGAQAEAVGAKLGDYAALCERLAPAAQALLRDVQAASR